MSEKVHYEPAKIMITGNKYMITQVPIETNMLNNNVCLPKIRNQNVQCCFLVLELRIRQCYTGYFQIHTGYPEITNATENNQCRLNQ